MNSTAAAHRQREGGKAQSRNEAQQHRQREENERRRKQQPLPLCERLPFFSHVPTSPARVFSSLPLLSFLFARLGGERLPALHQLCELLLLRLLFGVERAVFLIVGRGFLQPRVQRGERLLLLRDLPLADGQLPPGRLRPVAALRLFRKALFLYCLFRLCLFSPTASAFILR